jgi:hypothetical protein
MVQSRNKSNFLLPQKDVRNTGAMLNARSIKLPSLHLLVSAVLSEVTRL